MPTSTGRTNIVIWVDDFSKFTILRTTDQLTAQNLASQFEKEIIWQYGRPVQVRSDQGSEFKGAFEVACQTYGVTHVVTPPHAPWRNGRAERMVRTTKALIRKMMVDDP